jgi:sugar phosphate isomerase/epimerase
MIENAPPQYADLHIAHSLRDTVTLAEMAGIGVCIDLFSCWTEADLGNTIRRAIPACGLVQVSDYVCGDRALPARAVPGDGDMPLQRLLGWILDAGYQGVFDLELLGPRIDNEGHLAATGRAANAVAELLQALGA